MQNNRKMNLQELKSFGREISRTKWKGGSVFLIGFVLVLAAILLGIGGAIGTEFLGWDYETTKTVITRITRVANLLTTAMFVPLLLGWAKKEDRGFSDFWRMLTRKETIKIIGVEVLSLTILVIFFFLWAMLVWVTNTGIGAVQDKSVAVIHIAIIGIAAFILLAVRFSFVNQAIVDKNLGIIEALKYSWKITENHFWDIIVFHIYFLLWNIVGFLCLIVGVIWTSTMRQIAFSKLYLELSEQAEQAE